MATPSSSAAAAASTSQTGIPNISSLVASASSALTATSTSSPSVSVISGAPSLTSTSISVLTGLPTLSGYYSYAAPTVPPRAGAPYLQEIALPQNFVFIVVGAVIAFFAACLLAWRFLAAWSINRNIKRDGATAAGAAYTSLDAYTTDVKSGYSSGGGGGNHSNNHKRQSTLMSLSGSNNHNYNKEGTGNGKTTEQGHDMADLSHTLPKSFGNSVPSLFFSPTAEVARQSMIRPSSQHLMNGHYRDFSK